MAFLTQGVKPVGMLIGGFLGQAIGIRGALYFAAAGTLTSVVWAWRSPLRAKDAPDDRGATDDAGAPGDAGAPDEPGVPQPDPAAAA